MRGLFFILLVMLVAGCSDGGAPAGAGSGAGAGGAMPFDPNAVLAVFTNDMDLDGRHELFAVSFNGRLLNLAHTIGASIDVSLFALSPTGARVAFVVEDGLFVTAVNEDAPVRLSSDDAVEEIAWSPDGTKVAYRAVVEARQQLFVVNADGTGRRNLTGSDGETFVRIAWTADSQRILFHSDKETPNHHMLYSIRCDGTGEAKLSHTAAPSTSFRFVHFSVSGDGVAFRTDADVSGEYELWAGPADGSVPAVRLSTGGVKADAWAWSPDGGSLAYRVGDDLFVASKTGGNARRVSDVPVAAYTWGPDGRLAFRDTETLFVTDTLSPAVEVAAGASLTKYAWAPDGGEIAYLDGNELFIADTTGATASFRVLEPGVATDTFAWAPAPQLAQQRPNHLYFVNRRYTYDRLFGNYSGLATQDELGSVGPTGTTAVRPFSTDVAAFFNTEMLNQHEFVELRVFGDQLRTILSLGPDVSYAITTVSITMPPHAGGLSGAGEVLFDGFGSPQPNPLQYLKHFRVFADPQRQQAVTIEFDTGFLLPPQISIGPFQVSTATAQTNELAFDGGYDLDFSPTGVRVYFPFRMDRTLGYSLVPQSASTVLDSTPVFARAEDVGSMVVEPLTALPPLSKVRLLGKQGTSIKVKIPDGRDGWVKELLEITIAYSALPYIE